MGSEYVDFFLLVVHRTAWGEERLCEYIGPRGWQYSMYSTVCTDVQYIILGPHLEL